MINVRIQTPEVQKLSPKITVVGVGGAGGNAVNNMISSALEGCEFLVCNTDAQALEGSLCDNKLQLGAHVTGGLGAGAKPEVGEKAAQESLDEVMQYLEGSNMAFITAGMGGGTGTGAAPIIAKACRDSGILTVGVVTKPFHFEGTHRMKQAEAGIEEMQNYVDTLIVIPNQNLFRVANEKTTFAEAFKMADGVLQSGVRGVTDLMVMPGLINLDFADIRSAMLEMGKAMMGTGEAEGDRRATEAAEAAINNPLLDDVSMKGARGVIINVTGGHDMTLFEVDEACNRIRDEVDPNANIIFGSTFDEKLEGSMRVSVVATGIDVEQSVRTRGGTSGVRVTAIGKSSDSSFPAKKEVAAQRPQTEVARAMTLNARQESVAAKPAGSSLNISAPATASKPDMFASQEYHAAAPAPATTSTMRGSIHQGSFIPPSPVVPTPQEPVYAPASQYSAPQQQQDAEPQQQPAYAPMTAQRPASYGQAPQPQMAAPIQAPKQGLVLHPPVPGAHAAQRRRTPSLFERITGAYEAYKGGDHQDQIEETGAQSSSGTQSSGGFHAGGRTGFGQQPNIDAPSQGKLDIETPAAPKANEDDLDIPAFLRRQAN
ncbi:MAG TPA: cell division protein FtsZ [Alphaproteobacteria bacterium]|nr:cell division protein FtsZ [Alphaproteobacteria bacterium]